VYVSGAGGDKLIVLRSAAAQGDSGFTGKRRNGTGRPRKGRRLTGRQKTAVVTGGAKRKKKRWMIHLQAAWLGVL
jgi:hypothetical protein